MIAKIILENGQESSFVLTASDIERLNVEVAEINKLRKDVPGSREYTMADELMHGVYSWVSQLREKTPKKEKG